MNWGEGWVLAGGGLGEIPAASVGMTERGMSMTDQGVGMMESAGAAEVRLGDREGGAIGGPARCPPPPT